MIQDDFLAKKLEMLKDDLYYNHDNKSELNFFQSSVLHFAITLEVGISTHSNSYASYEKICEKIPKKFGSRSTIQSILNDAVELGYFIKAVSDLDKRVKIYKLSPKFTEDISSWMNKFVNNKAA